MARLLITGGAGFVGLHTAEAARARGHEVVLADRRPLTPPPWLPEEGVTGRHLDVTDADAVLEACANVDAVIHAAAIVGPAPAKADPVAAVRTNVTGTQNVLEAARRHRLAVVALSTATLYGHRPDLGPLDETVPADPVGIYDATKLMAEILADAYRKTWGVAVASLRPGFVFGMGHSTGEYVVDRVLRGEAVHLVTGGDNPCDFTYVVDLAEALVRAVEHMPLPHAVYNVTGGRLLTRRDFIDAVRHALPDADVAIGAGRDPGLHLRGPSVIERARRDFGYSPRFGLDDAIADWIRRERM